MVLSLQLGASTVSHGVLGWLLANVAGRRSLLFLNKTLSPTVSPFAYFLGLLLRANKFTSFDTKQRKILFARWCAFAVISLIWSDGDMSCATIIPRSRQNYIYGTQ